MSKLRVIVLAVLLAAPGALLFAPAAHAAAATYDVASVPFRPMTLDGFASSLGMPTGSTTGGIGIGFQTTFFGHVADTFWVSRHGFITLQSADSDGCCEGGVIPGSVGPSQFLAGFWTRLDPDAGGSVRFERMNAPTDTNASQVLVVAFENVPSALDHNVTNTFQMLVFDNGVYEVQWTNVTAVGNANVTIGMEDSDSSNGVLVARATGLSHHQEAIRFTPVAGTPNPAPTIGSISPNQGRPGDIIDVQGTGFVSNARVIVFDPFGNAFIQFPNSLTSTNITFSVPNIGSGPTNVTVMNPDGQQSNAIAFQVLAAPIRLDFLSPGRGTPGMIVAAIGGGFSPNTRVFFDGSQVGSNFVSSSQINFQIPPTNPGAHGVFLVDPASGGTTGTQTLFVDQPFSITSISPNHAQPGASVQIQGQGFQNPNVFLNGNFALLDFTTSDGTLLQFRVPNVQPGPTQVVVQNQNGQSISIGFTVDAIPTPPNFRVDSVTPTHGQPGTRIVVSGGGFVDGARVRIGGADNFAQVTSPTTIETFVPGIAPGAASLVVVEPDGASAAAPGGFVVDSRQVRLDFIEPAAARPGEFVTLHGAGLGGGGDTILFGQTRAQNVGGGGDRIVAFVPDMPGGVVDVSVIPTDNSAPAVLHDGFRVIVGPKLDAVAPSSALPHDTIALHGSGFAQDTVVTVGGHVLPALLSNPSQIFVTLDDVRSGSVDITVTGQGNSWTLPHAIFVKPVEDLAVESIAMRGPSAAGAGALPVATTASFDILVRNEGELAAPRASMAVDVAGDPSSPALVGSGLSEHVATLDVPALQAGQSVTLTATWTAAGNAGDFVVTARLHPAARELRIENDLGTSRFFLIASGFRGVNLCNVTCGAAIPPAPALTEDRLTTRTFSNQADTHRAAAFSFHFEGPALVDIQGASPSRFTGDGGDGATFDCTSWQLGNSSSSFSLFTNPVNGDGGGVLSVGHDSSRSGSGSSFVQQTREYVVAGLPVTSTSSFATGNITQPQSNYPADSTSGLFARATGDSGTVTQCAFHSVSGERITVDGSVNAATLSVDAFRSSTDITRVVGILAPSTSGPGAQGDAPYALQAGARVTAEAHFADGVGSTRFAFLQFTGATGGPGQRLQPTPECTEWIGTFDEAAMRALASDGASNVTLTIDGAILAVPQSALSYHGTPLDMELVGGGAGALSGTLLVCDQPGNGLVRMSMQATEPAALRVTLGGEI